MQNLSLRLKTIFDLIPQNAKVCDIGCDHAFLSIELVKSGKAKSVIAADINEKPLKKAEENIKKAGVENISLRLCDGLSKLEKGEADTVIIAGIGGEVIWGIISRGMEIVANKDTTLILQPTTSPEFLRKNLYENGFEILSEAPVEENGKLYSVMRCVYSGEKAKREEYFYFSGLVDPKNPIGKKYIEKQRDRAYKCMAALCTVENKKEELAFHKEIYENLWRLTADS
ncbi:MAG: SAM-dependent methyltransferase [Clostridia bacterium]|nr:SAM-dependent methyltransferase [Clostridia bacterium]